MSAYIDHFKCSFCVESVHLFPTRSECFLETRYLSQTLFIFRIWVLRFMSRIWGFMFHLYQCWYTMCFLSEFIFLDLGVYSKRIIKQFATNCNLFTMRVSTASNVVACCPKYHSRWPNTWLYSQLFAVAQTSLHDKSAAMITAVCSSTNNFGCPKHHFQQLHDKSAAMITAVCSSTNNFGCPKHHFQQLHDKSAAMITAVCSSTNNFGCPKHHFQQLHDKSAAMITAVCSSTNNFGCPKHHSQQIHDQYAAMITAVCSSTNNFGCPKHHFQQIHDKV